MSIQKFLDFNKHVIKDDDHGNDLKDDDDGINGGVYCENFCQIQFIRVIIFIRKLTIMVIKISQVIIIMAQFEEGGKDDHEDGGGDGGGVYSVQVFIVIIIIAQLVRVIL